MSYSQRIVINSLTRRSSTAVILPNAHPDHPWLEGSSVTVRALQALVVMSLFGALANEVVGVGAAMVLALLVLPVAIASLTLGVVSRGDNADKALQYALAAAFIAPLLALPGTLLGLTATILALAAAAVVGCGMKRWFSPASPVSRPELLGLSL